MGRFILCFIAASWILATASFGADSTVSLSDLEAQATTEAAEAGTTALAPTEAVTDYSRYRMQDSTNNLILALSVMGAGLFSLFLVLWYLKSRDALPETMVNGSGLVLVVFATLLVMILAKADQQLTAATGILGAIAGYLFGKTSKGPEGEQKPGKTVSS